MARFQTKRPKRPKKGAPMRATGKKLGSKKRVKLLTSGG